MSSSSTTLTEDTTIIEQEFEALKRFQTDAEDWPLGSQLIRVHSRSEQLATLVGMVLQPMEPFISRNIRYRLDAGPFENPRCLIFARAGSQTWRIQEGVNQLEFPSSAGSLLLYIQVGGPIGTPLHCTVGEQRQCS